MKFKVIFDIDTEAENGSTAKSSIIDEDGKEIPGLPKKEVIALAFHLSRGASNILRQVIIQDYIAQ